MQCPTCQHELLEGPTLRSTTTYLWCLFCNRHWTLDGYEVFEPADYWLDDAAIRYCRHLGISVTPMLTDEEWIAWMETQGYTLIGDE